jgi:hypothetical protein
MTLAPSDLTAPAPANDFAPSVRFPTPAPETGLAACVRAGLAIMLEAFDCAGELKRDVWDFAVGIHDLRGAGLTSSSLRWLLCKGYAEHALETSRPHAAQRTFRPAGNLMFCDRSCFVLTPAGAAVAAGAQSPAPAFERSGHSPTPPAAAPAAGPRWDAEHRELRWGGKLVKRFRLPALNQELILAVFEEEGWPAHIDDPLPVNINYDPKQRLEDTIKRLNKHQVNRLIRFRGDGSGCGVRWEPCR